jgi:type II secretory pathway predicted ATPase ExeA
MPERHTLTLSLTYKQVAILRQAVFDFADGEYEKRMRRLRSDPTATMRSAVEVAAEELASLITEATDVAMTPEESHVPNV